MTSIAAHAGMFSLGGGSGPSGSYFDAVMALSPHEYFPLRELSGTVASNYGAHAVAGTYAGTSYTQGDSSLLPSGEGSSMTKSGTGRVTFATPVSLNKPFTIGAWVRRTGTAATDKVILTLGANGGAQLALDSTNHMRGGAASSFNLSSGPSVLNTNTNYFVVFTVGSGGAYKYYLNNSLDFSGTTASNFGSGNSPSTIGIFADSTNFPFVGSLQEIMVFTRELSAGEISGLYAAAQ